MEIAEGDKLHYFAELQASIGSLQVYIWNEGEKPINAGDYQSKPYSIFIMSEV